METRVPYHAGFLLGRSVDARKMQPGYMLIDKEYVPYIENVNKTTSQFSFVTNLADVCRILDLPPEYVLKVRAGVFENEMVDACLKSIGKTDSFTVAFRITYVEQRQHLPSGVIPLSSHSYDKHQEDDNGHQTKESLIADASSSYESQPKKRQGHCGTHWIKAREIGNELVTVMTVSCKDISKLDKLIEKMIKYVKYYGQLDSEKMKVLHKLAAKIDKKLSKKKKYGNVHLDIHYCSFKDLDKYPSDMQGMVKIVKAFMDQCTGWTEGSKFNSVYKIEACFVKCIVGTDKEKNSVKNVKEKRTTLQDILDSGAHQSSLGSDESVKNHPSKEACGQEEDINVDEDTDSYVVLFTGQLYFYNLRVIFESFERASHCDATCIEKLFKLQVNCESAEELIQKFTSTEIYYAETHSKEINRILKNIFAVHASVKVTVTALNFVNTPSETIENIISSDPLDTVRVFIENATSKLPTGGDVDLLMIGKTGHGKSSTGNSILGRDIFAFSADGDSKTKNVAQGWTEIDGRRIKVVDSPGVCDTSSDEKSGIDLAIRSVSEAIANCPAGFHALLLVIRFGVRITAEEVKAVGLLKHILGENIIKSHSVCIITHGDNFETEMEGKKTCFMDWCKSQTEDLRNLFKECNYRCVLFNNKAKDTKTKKTQLIHLMTMVDSVNKNGTRYTNDLFELVQRERDRIIHKAKVPQMNEDIIRDIQLIHQNLHDFNNTSSRMQYKEALLELNEKVNDLTSILKMTQNEQLRHLEGKISALQTKIDKIANSHETTAYVASNSAPESGDENEENLANSERLKIYEEDLQIYCEKEVSPNQTMIIEKVTEKVEAEIKRKGGCFPRTSVVTLISGKSITLEELQVGDKVLVRDKAGHLSYDTIYMFGHQELETDNEFIVIKTASQTVSVTAEHYVFCTKDGKELCVAAEKICVGDCLLVSVNEGLIPHEVKEVTYERKKGLFAPFTNSGTIIIDGTLMSCYISVLPHKICHALLWPMRQLYRHSPHALAYINGSPLHHPVPRWAVAALKLMQEDKSQWLNIMYESIM